MSTNMQLTVYPTMFFDFYEQTPPKGWLPRYGEVLPNASRDYPELLAYLTDPDNAWKVKTEAEWQTMSQDAAWNGTGGVPYFVVDAAADTIRLPDTRGMYAENAGFDGLDVGGVHGDATRRVKGTFGVYTVTGDGPTGAFSAVKATSTARSGASKELWGVHTFDTATVVPTANKNQPRAFGMLPCVFVGGVAGQEPAGPEPEYPDDGESWSDITILASARGYRDTFSGITALEDGYMLTGDIISGQGFLGKYSADLTPMRLKSYHSGSSLIKSAIMTPTGGCLACGRAGGSGLWLATDNAGLPIKSFVCGNIVHGTFNRAISTPEGFASPTEYVLAGGFIATLDKDFNALKLLKPDGVYFNDVAATESKIVAVGVGCGGSVIMEFDASLNCIKARAFTGVNTLVFSSIVREQNGWVISGLYRDTNIRRFILMLRLDNDFNVVDKALLNAGGHDDVCSMSRRPDGRFLLAGTTTSIGAGGSDAFVLELERDFTPRRALTLGGTNDDAGMSVVRREDGTIALAGYVHGGGGADAFLALFRGSFPGMTGSMAKYPNIRINGQVNFNRKNDVTLNLNLNPSVPMINSLSGVNQTSLTVDSTAFGWVTVDPNATIIV